MTFTCGNDVAMALVPSVEWSSTTMISKAIPCCATSDSKHNPRMSCSFRAGMITETAGPGTSDGSGSMGGFVIIGLVKRLAYILVVMAVLSFSGCNSGTAPPKIGTVAPDFTVQDVDRKVTLSELRGKIVVLNFWASWCGPCIAETPSLVAMQNRLRDRDVVVLAVSADEDDSAYHRFVKEQNMNMLTVRDADKKSNDLYGTHVFPETYIIDRNGVLRRKVIGEMNWTAQEMTEYLTKL